MMTNQEKIEFSRRHRLECSGPCFWRTPSSKDWQSLNYKAVRILIEYIEWCGYKRACASQAINSGDFETYSKEIDDVNRCHRFINIDNAFYPSDFARQIILYRAQAEGETARAVYHRLRRSAHNYTDLNMSFSDREAYKIEAMVYDCLRMN